MTNNTKYRGPKMTKLISTMCLFVALGAVSACGTNPGAASAAASNSSAPAGGTPQGNENLITVNGTVVNPHLDGCKVLVCANDNASGGSTKCFIPTNIDQSRLPEGQNVSLTGYVRQDIMTTCMAGPVLNVIQAQ
jgi:hypothetical protein